MENGSLFHILQWTSHRSLRPAISTPAAEILAVSEAVEDTVVLKEFMTTVQGTKVKSMVFFDSKDFFCSLSSTKKFYQQVRP